MDLSLFGTQGLDLNMGSGVLSLGSKWLGVFLQTPGDIASYRVIWGQREEINLCLLVLKRSYLSGFRKQSVM